MTRIVAFAFFAFISLASGSALPATSPPVPTRTEIYCSGMYSIRSPQAAGYVVSGEDAADKLVFAQGDSIYLHLAARSAAKAGDQFLVVRPAEDSARVPWFSGQRGLEKRMGRLWEDIGRVRVVEMNGNVAVGQIESSCTPMESGDMVLPFETRPVPALPAARPKGTSANYPRAVIGRVVSSKGFRQILGAGHIAYVDLGTRQGVRVGDRLLLFRYPSVAGGEMHHTGWPNPRLDGFDHSETRNPPGQSPRETLGEAVILRVSPTAATILIASSRREIDLGDYAALE